MKAVVVFTIMFSAGVALFVAAGEYSEPASLLGALIFNICGVLLLGSWMSHGLRTQTPPEEEKESSPQVQKRAA